MNKEIAVLIPCFNESKTIKKVIEDFRLQLPEASIYVYDNNSTDATVAIARKAGAIIGREERQGKGSVVRRMFKQIDADLYVIVDGDDTYPAEYVQDLITLVENGADIAVGDRLSGGEYAIENKRNFHNFGNTLVRALINRLFHVKLNDIMSGYRVFSRDFVKHYPVLCEGFQIETDMTIFALDHNFVIKESSVPYRDRPKGSNSKLRTIPDGMRVILTIFNLYRHYRPLVFFGFFSMISFCAGIIVGMPVIIEYIQNSYIFKVPSAILASGSILLSVVIAAIGIILDSVRRVGKEQFEIIRR